LLLCGTQQLKLELELIAVEDSASHVQAIFIEAATPPGRAV
jgi:hypothetical protein